MIAFYTRFTTREEHRDELVSILSQASASMGNVSGCTRYDVVLDIANPAITSVIEFWDDEASHDASLQLPEAKELIAKAMPLMTAKPQQAKLGPVITSWV